MGKMLAAANQFGLKRLEEIYESRILERVSVESVAYLLHLAERCHATELKDGCLRFATKNRAYPKHILIMCHATQLKDACDLKFAAKNEAVVLESNGVGFLKEACPLLLLELAGYTEKPSTDGETELDFQELPSITLSRERELDFRTKIVSVVAECSRTRS